jgi:nitronate monooxygenase
MPIRTALTELLAIRHPVLSAPMAGVSGGALAAAVTGAGGLGLLGGGYGDRDWLERELRAAGNARVGIGFITWSLERQPELLDLALDHAPAAIFLSFGDCRPFAGRVANAPARLILQVQTVEQAKAALDAGADILVAQGTEAGGHGGRRATLPLVPAIVDIAGSVPVVAAGGIADGRGLAAALMLGAAGVLCGTAFYASDEALTHPEAKAAAVAGSGDATLRSSVFDLARGLDWPADWDLRTLRNAFSERWAGAEAGLVGDAVRRRYAAAVAEGDVTTAAVIVGEAVDLLTRREPAAAIV